MDVRLFRVVEQAKAYVRDNWGLTVIKDEGHSELAFFFGAKDASGNKHHLKICVKPETGPRRELFIEYLERELAVQRTLDHENVVKLYNGVSLPDCVIFDMEPYDILLNNYARERGKALPVGSFRALARQITAGVHYLHSKGIAHRDLKPGNFLVCLHDDGACTAKIDEFSFAKKEEDGLDEFVGTPMFQAPEVFLSVTEGKSYTKKCDMWSLGMTYYNLLTGEYAIPMTDSWETVFEQVTNSKLVAFDLPDSLDVSDCCRHFVRNHLFKDPDLRFSAEEAMSHPFLLSDLGKFIQLATPPDSRNFVKPLVSDVGIGDVVFGKVKRMLGDKINEPHALSVGASSTDSIAWEDVARVFHLEDKDVIEDLCVVTDDGSFFSSTDLVPRERYGELTAVLISGKNGIVAGEIKAEHHCCLTEEDYREIQSFADSPMELLDAYGRAFFKFFRECFTLAYNTKRVYENCSLLENIRDTVMKYDRMIETIVTLQQELRKKFEDFPVITFIPPAAAEEPRKTVWKLSDIEPLELGKKQINDQTMAAVNKIRSGIFDLSQEIAKNAEILDRNKVYEQQFQNDLDEAYESMSYVMKTLSFKAEVLSCMFRYIKLLRKALELDDPRAIYPELRSLLPCKYFDMSAECQSIVMGDSSTPAK